MHILIFELKLTVVYVERVNLLREAVFGSKNLTLLLFERRNFIFNFARINAGVYFFAYRSFKFGVLNQLDYDLFNGPIYLVLAPLPTIIAKMPIHLTSVFANIVEVISI